MARTHFEVAALVAAFTLLSPVCSAQSVYKPIGLQPGDPYRIAFVTRGTIDATSPDISTYNEFVEEQAAASGSVLAVLDTHWAAVASTSTVDASDNIGTDALSTDPSEVPVYLANGVNRVTASHDALWVSDWRLSSLEHPIAMNQYGDLMTVGPNLVWTGTDWTGRKSFFPLGDGANTTVGGLSSEVSSWIFAGTVDSTSPRFLYGISGILIAIPEPTTATLLILGVMGGGMRRRG